MVGKIFLKRIKIIHNFYILTGVPGSGKSTTAQNLLLKIQNMKHFEADMFFINKNGEYKWNPNLLHKAHQWCFNSVENEMKKGNDVIVSNTFITKSSRKPYFDLAKKYKYNIHVIECKGRYKNIHGVNENKIEILRKKYQPVTKEEYENN